MNQASVIRCMARYAWFAWLCPSTALRIPRAGAVYVMPDKHDLIVVHVRHASARGVCYSYMDRDPPYHTDSVREFLGFFVPFSAVF